MLSTRFFTARFDTFFKEADKVLTEQAAVLFTEAAERVAEQWGARVKASGRGGSHNADMANIKAKVTQPKKGGFFVRIGWLNSPPAAADGKTSWYVYQDAGYDPFGMIGKGIPAARVPGLFAQMDARQNASRYFEEAVDDIKRYMAQAARKTR